jgi:hypothetical protein
VAGVLVEQRDVRDPNGHGRQTERVDTVEIIRVPRKSFVSPCLRVEREKTDTQIVSRRIPLLSFKCKNPDRSMVANMRSWEQLFSLTSSRYASAWIATFHSSCKNGEDKSRMSIWQWWYKTVHDQSITFELYMENCLNVKNLTTAWLLSFSLNSLKFSFERLNQFKWVTILLKWFWALNYNERRIL